MPNKAQLEAARSQDARVAAARARAAATFFERCAWPENQRALQTVVDLLSDAEWRAVAALARSCASTLWILPFARDLRRVLFFKEMETNIHDKMLGAAKVAASDLELDPELRAAAARVAAGDDEEHLVSKGADTVC